MQCYKCENQINLEKYHTNGKKPEESIKVNANRIPLAKNLGPSKVKKKPFFQPLESPYYKEDIQYFLKRNQDKKEHEEREKAMRMKIKKETEDFLERMNESSKRYLKTDNNKENGYLKQFYNDYVEKIYRTPQRERPKPYWLNNIN
jgi:ATP-dependent Zn protease